MAGRRKIIQGKRRKNAAVSQDGGQEKRYRLNDDLSLYPASQRLREQPRAGRPGLLTSAVLNRQQLTGNAAGQSFDLSRVAPPQQPTTLQRYSRRGAQQTNVGGQLGQAVRQQQQQLPHLQQQPHHQVYPYQQQRGHHNSYNSYNGQTVARYSNSNGRNDGYATRNQGGYVKQAPSAAGGSGYPRPPRRAELNYSETNPWPNDKHWNHQQEDSRELPHLPFLF